MANRIPIPGGSYASKVATPNVAQIVTRKKAKEQPPEETKKRFVAFMQAKDGKDIGHDKLISRPTQIDPIKEFIKIRGLRK